MILTFLMNQLFPLLPWKLFRGVSLERFLAAVQLQQDVARLAKVLAEALFLLLTTMFLL